MVQVTAINGDERLAPEPYCLIMSTGGRKKMWKEQDPCGMIELDQSQQTYDTLPLICDGINRCLVG